MEKGNNRRRFILIANIGVGLSGIVGKKLASMSDSKTIAVVSPNEVEKVPDVALKINYIINERYSTDVKLIDVNSTGGKHKGGKKNKRNKRW